MKKLITIIGLLALVFIGCSNPVESPIELVSQSYTSLNKENDYGTDDPTSLLDELYIEKEIDGKNGGKLTLEGTFQNYFGDIVTVKATITIPEDAYKGKKVISMRTDKYFPVMKFGPEGSFKNSLKLDLKFTGMQLERYDLTDGKTDFCFLSDDGIAEVIKADGLNVNLSEKKAEVRGAKLNHFSRYGFIRRCEGSIRQEHKYIQTK